ncbi:MULTISPECIES: hypothetical protein [unclassified Arthrobacter]|uniref:hypothetical protein n=1 Tax=unclassified Arthrobacter TaxID=235627 RepID=UPI001491C8B6|nr:MULTISPECIES: hypothetical protein [unclassified Arthrobacter]MBE0008358.1 hypothetical protein [Arthrobacter sp. AET 35A]NOJ62097.1 hypothetical protein [Arthrobacter sp. 147(2020)]
MTEHLIQWIVLASCIIFALLRLPDAIRGRGRSVFAAMVLLVVAVGLSLPQIYLPVDGLLGGMNLANLIIRLSLFAIFVLLGIRIAGAFRSPRTRWLIVGPLGLTVLGVVVAVTVVLFVLSDLPESSTGLQAFRDQDTVRLYAEAGRLYPGYVAACLVLPAVKGLMDPAGRLAYRSASALLAVGFGAVVVFAVTRLLAGAHLGIWEIVLPFGSILLVVSGLTVIWASRRRTELTPPGNRLA